MRNGILTRILSHKTRFGITQFLHLIMQNYMQNLGCFESHFSCQNSCHFPCQNKVSQTAFLPLFDTDSAAKRPLKNVQSDTKKTYINE